MSSAGDTTEVAHTLHDRLKQVFGTRLRGLVLYGSRVLGDADEGSGFDFLVLLDRVESFSVDHERLSPVTAELSLEHDTLISALPVAEHRFASERTPFFLNARREGLLFE